jgi:outer membrane protein assembly factor BamE (lipoprotein component of BamABCDE complex)
MHAPSPQQLSWIARAIGLAMLVFAVFSVYAVATCYESPVDPYALDALQEGATQMEVVAALGKPTSIEEDGRKWIYSRFMKVRVVEVTFDGDNLLLTRGYTDVELESAPDSEFDDDLSIETGGEAEYASDSE